MNTNPLTITMYRWAGEKFGVKITSECNECDVNLGILEDMKQKEFFGRPVTIEIKPWLTYLWEALRVGGWHAPVIVVNKKLFSQGVIVDREKLATYVECSTTHLVDLPSKKWTR